MPDEINVSQRVIRVPLEPSTVTFVVLLSATGAFGVAVSFLYAAFAKPNLQLPKTATLGVAFCGLYFGLLMIYNLICRRTICTIDLDRKVVIEVVAIVGSAKSRSQKIIEPFYLGYNKNIHQSRCGGVIKSWDQYCFYLRDRGGKIHISNESDGITIQKIIAFFKDNGVEVREERYVNKVGMLLTIAFMLAVFLELHLTGKI